MMKKFEMLSSVKQAAFNLAEEYGHGKMFVISYPDKLLTTQYSLQNSLNNFLSPCALKSVIDYSQTKMASSLQNSPIGLYLHLPFCEQKCKFCNFAVSTIQDQAYQTSYVEKLIKDLDFFTKEFKGEISSIDIGGGTPLLLSEDNLIKLSSSLNLILKKIRAKHYCSRDFSFEQTSKIASNNPNKMQALMSCIESNLPVRTSMGIQTTSKQALVENRRSVTEIGHYSSNPVLNCRKALPPGSHVSADLIFPMGTKEEFIQTIQHSIDLGFDTITAYDLIDTYGGGIRKAFKGKPTYTKKDYGEYYDIWYYQMLKSNYIVRYGSSNAIKMSALLEFSRGKEYSNEQLLDLAAECAVSKYYHERISNNNSFIGLGVGASSRINRSLSNLEKDVWLFNSNQIESWIKNDVSQGEFSGSAYCFPWQIWLTKDIRHQLANCGCIHFDKLNYRYFVYLQEYNVGRIEDLFCREIEFVTLNKLMIYDEHKLCLNEGKYEYLSHIRGLFTDDLLLHSIIKAYQDDNYLQHIYAERTKFEKDKLAQVLLHKACE